MHDLHIQRVCDGVNETVTAFFFALLQVKPYFTENYRYYVSLRTEKLLFQKCMNFLNYIMFGYIHLYVWQISNFLKYSSTVYGDCSPAFNGTICIIATVTWPGQKAITFTFKNQQMCKILFLLFWNASWLSFTSHSMKLQLVNISGWVNNPNYNLGFIKTQNRTSNYHFTKILHRNTL